MKKNKLLTVASATIFICSSCPLALAKTAHNDSSKTLRSARVMTAPLINLNAVSTESTNDIQLTINYQENGKTVKTVTKTCQSGADISVMPDMPSGYKVKDGWSMDGQSISVQDGKASVNVPVEKDNSTTNSSNSSSHQEEPTYFTAQITYSYNGKEVGNASEVQKYGDPIDILKNMPKGYKVADDYNGQSNIEIKNGVAKLTVPVVPTSDSSSNSSSNSGTSDSFVADITYTCDGKVVKTVCENCKTGSPIDIVKNLPDGYQISSSYHGESNIPINNGKASLTVPVEKVADNSSSNTGSENAGSSSSSVSDKITAVINYQSNGKTISSITLHNLNPDEKVNVSDNLPKGYKIDPSYDPGKSVQVVNGTATFNVPVITDDNSGATDNTSSNSQTGSNSSNSSATDNSQPASDDKNSSTAGDNSSNGSNDATSNSSSVDDSKNNGNSSNETPSNGSSTNGTDNSGNQSSNDDNKVNSSSSNDNQDKVSSNGGSADVDSSSADKDNISNSGSNSGTATTTPVNNGSQGSSNKTGQTVQGTTSNADKKGAVNDLTGDLPTKKINYVDSNGNQLKSVDTKNGVANKDKILDNAPDNTQGAKYSYDKNGNLKVTLPQTGENNRNSIIGRMAGAITLLGAILGGIVAYRRKRV